MKHKRWVLIALIWAAVGVVRASELDAMLENIHTMKSDFTQTIQDNHGKTIQTAYGKMALARPGKFRWQTTKPLPQTIIANGTRLWIYDPDLEQVTIRALHQAAGETPALMLSHENTEIDKDYLVKRVANKKNGTWFILIPKNQDSVFEKMEMGFRNHELVAMSLHDHLGHRTEITFQHTQTNITLPNSLFVFKGTPHIDVIDETRHKH